jgi:phosphoserine phosphatase
MGGQVLFQDALAARLNIIKPSKSDVANFLKTKNIGNNSNGLPTQRLTPGVQELIDLLHAKGKIVYLVSGGFRQVMPHVVVAVPFGKTVVLYLCLCVS